MSDDPEATRYELHVEPTWTDQGWNATASLRTGDRWVHVHTWPMMTTAMGDQPDFARWSAGEEFAARLREALRRDWDDAQDA